MGTLERELASLIEQIRQAEIDSDTPVCAVLIEDKRRLCSLLEALG